MFTSRHKSQQQLEELIDKYITPVTQTTLANLHGSAPEIIDMVIQTVPVASRAGLVAAGLATQSGSGPESRLTVHLKPVAYEVMAVLAERARTNPAGFDNWTRNEDGAAAVVAGHTKRIRT